MIFSQGLLQVMLLSTSAHITRQLKMAPGGEFRAAHRASFSVQGCRVILGDRPISITLKRALSSLGFFQQLRLVSILLLTSQVATNVGRQCRRRFIQSHLPLA